MKFNRVGEVSIVKHVVNIVIKNRLLSASFKLHKPFVKLTKRNQYSTGDNAIGRIKQKAHKEQSLIFEGYLFKIFSVKISI